MSVWFSSRELKSILHHAERFDLVSNSLPLLIMRCMHEKRMFELRQSRGEIGMRSQGMHIAKKAAPKRMQSYYEVLFFKSGALHTEYWRVYFELHGEDLAILKEGKSLGL